jgi:hypothetical protein
MSIYRSQRGWQFTISTYPVVSFDSPVAKYAEEGNIEGLQELFMNGEASPFCITSMVCENYSRRHSLLDVS